MHEKTGSKRVMSSCIDMGIMCLFILLMTGVSQYLGQELAISITVIVCLAYVIVFPLTIGKGQSLGKKIAKIKVTDLEGNDISKAKIIFRELIKYGLSIGTCSAYFFICAIMVLVRNDEASIHDIIFKTKVSDVTLKEKIADKKYKEFESINTDSFNKL